MSSARENILNKITSEYNVKPFEQTGDIFVKSDDNLISSFINELETVSGQVFVLNSLEEIKRRIIELIQEKNFRKVCSNIKDLLGFQDNVEVFESYNSDIDLSISKCEYISARTGSIVVSSKITERRSNVYAPTHIFVAHESQLVKDIDVALKKIKDKYSKMPSFVSVITGPSRTADIEKTLILGAHGPKKLIVYIIKE